MPGPIGIALSGITEPSTSLRRAAMREKATDEDILAFLALGDRVCGRVAAMILANGSLETLVEKVPVAKVRRARNGLVLLGVALPEKDSLPELEWVEDNLVSLADEFNDWVLEHPEASLTGGGALMTFSPAWGPAAAELAMANPLTSLAVAAVAAGAAYGWSNETFATIWSSYDTIDTDALTDLVSSDERDVQYTMGLLVHAALSDGVRPVDQGGNVADLGPLAPMYQNSQRAIRDL